MVGTSVVGASVAGANVVGASVVGGSEMGTSVEGLAHTRQQPLSGQTMSPTRSFHSGNTLEQQLYELSVSRTDENSGVVASMTFWSSSTMKESNFVSFVNSSTGLPSADSVDAYLMITS